MDNALTIVISIIGVLGTCSSIFFAILAFRRNEKGDHKSEGKNEGVLISDVGYIKSSIDRIEKSMDKLEIRFSELEGRVIKAETNIANVSKNLDDHIKNKGLHSKGGKS